MSRVTFREPSGKWGVKGVSWAEVPDGLYGALYKLRRYRRRLPTDLAGGVRPEV